MSVILAGCLSVRALKDGSLILRLASPNDKQTAMKHLAEKYDIDEIKVFEPSLNDIFVEYAVEQE